jgi:(2Fe-2S) ferredoxin
LPAHPAVVAVFAVKEEVWYHAVTESEIGDLVSHRRHHTCGLVTENMRQRGHIPESAEDV